MTHILQYFVNFVLALYDFWLFKWFILLHQQIWHAYPLWVSGTGLGTRCRDKTWALLLSSSQSACSRFQYSVISAIHRVLCNPKEENDMTLLVISSIHVLEDSGQGEWIYQVQTLCCRETSWHCAYSKIASAPRLMNPSVSIMYPPQCPVYN